MIRPFAQPRRGIAAPAVALCLIVLLGVLALAMDGGVLMTERRHAQAAADAAAFAAAADLYSQQMANPSNPGLDGSSGYAKTSAFTTAAGNGYSSSNVTVNMPADTFAEGANAGNTIPHGEVEVIILGSQTRAFSSIFGLGNLPVHARAVALGLVKPYSAAGIILLDPSGKDSFNNSGSGIVVSGSANVIIDSSNTEAANLSGSAVLNANQVVMTGGLKTSGSAQVIGLVTYSNPPTPDPLASIPAPDKSKLAVQSSSNLHYSSGSHTLSPGVYTGGITLSSPASATLNPGIYYLDGGGLTVSGGASLVGNNVMIYNDPHQVGDQVNISGSGTLTLTPPTSGTYAGISLFQNRTSNVQITLSGGSSTSMQGTFYAAAAPMNVSGASGIKLGSQYISYDLTVSGSASFTVDRGNGNVARKRQLYLME
jgi:hypothetical protein